MLNNSFTNENFNLIKYLLIFVFVFFIFIFIYLVYLFDNIAGPVKKIKSKCSVTSSTDK